MVATPRRLDHERTGIRERHILKGKGLGTSQMGAEAGAGLLHKRPPAIKRLTLICATTTAGFRVFRDRELICDPGSGSKYRLLSTFRPDCSGIPLRAHGERRRSSSENRLARARSWWWATTRMARIIDYTDRAPCVLFGGRSRAVLVEPSKNGHGIRDT